MRDPDTSMGGFRRVFPPTTGGLLSQLRSQRNEIQPDLLETIGRRYWKPVYRFIRAGWRKSNEEAKDLAQGYFVWLFESGTLRNYRSDQGTLRVFLKILVRQYLSHDQRDRKRLKRGGSRQALSLDVMAKGDIPADPKSLDAEAEFDRAWRNELVRRARDAVRDECRAGKALLQYRVFERYEDHPPGNSLTYQQVADELGVKKSDVRNYLFAIRERIRSKIRTEIAELVNTPGELQDEWEVLFGG